jgi:propanediol dehydratase large subunit
MKNIDEAWFEEFNKVLRDMESDEGAPRIQEDQVEHALKIALKVFSKLMNSPVNNTKGFAGNFAHGNASNTSVTCPVCETNITILKPKT